MTSTPAPEPAIGFYTVEHSETLGWTGGYLLLNSGGRPLEFHCTLPVLPSRTHEILYGETLRSFLIGEAIGSALLAKARLQPQLLCVDQPEAMPLESGFGVTCIHWLGRSGTGASSARSVPANDRLETPSGRQITHRGQLFVCREDKRVQVETALRNVGGWNDWKEPFDRIREAIREAQQGAAARAA
jgi:hypothetical protein